MKKYIPHKRSWGKDLLFFLFVFSVTMVFAISASYAETKRGPKTQEVNFDGSSVDGEARRPDGAFLSQRRGGEFIPLYKVREQFDQSIKDSVDHLR